MRLVFVTLLTVSIVGCAPNKARVVERHVKTSKQKTEYIGGVLVRVVQPGDTLYAIAFANGLNVNELAAWNNIVDSRRLQIGQKIRLTRPPNFVAKTASKQKSALTKSRQKKSTAANNTAKASKTKQQSTKSRSTVKMNNLVNWRWPISGRVISRFAASRGLQGIDIQGKHGESVSASAEGEVVYVGNGLKGYGNLIIIKHNDEFLSAYAHNKEVFVKEGDKVKAKAIISSVGTNQSGLPALHFQIRKGGSPVNPLAYLPKVG